MSNAENKKSHVLAVIIVTFVIISAAVTCMILYIPKVNNAVKKLLMSEVKYVKSVNNSDLTKKLSFFDINGSEISESGYDSDDLGTNGTNQTIDFEFCEDLSENISWLKNVHLDLNTTLNDDAVKLDIKCNVNDLFDCSITYISDIENGNIYFGIPEYNDSYMKFSRDILSENYNITSPVLFNNDPDLWSVDNDNTFLSIASNLEDIKSVLLKYVNMFFDSLKDIQLSDDEEYGLEGISKSCTKVTVSLSEDEQKEIFEKIIIELRNDEAFKKIYKQYLEKGILNHSTFSFDEFIDRAEKDIQNISSDNKEFVINEWIDNCGNILAFEVYEDNISQLRLSFLNENNDYVFELGFWPDSSETGYFIRLLLTGRLDDNMFSGTYTLKNGMREDKCKINNFSLSRLMQGEVEYEMVITNESVGNSLVDNFMNDDENSYCVVDTFKSANETNENYRLVDDDKTQLIVNSNIKEKKSKENIIIPDNYVDIYYDWLDKLDYKQMYYDMADSGIPVDFYKGILEIIYGLNL